MVHLLTRGTHGLHGWSRWYVGGRAAEPAAFAALLNNELGPILATLGNVTEVRTHPFSPYKASAWNTPGVAHDYPEDQQFHGSIIIGATDRDALHAALGKP